MHTHRRCNTSCNFHRHDSSYSITSLAYGQDGISLSPLAQTTKFLSQVISTVTSFKKTKTMGEPAQKGIICYLHAKISECTKAERIFSSEEQHQAQLQGSAEINSNMHLTLWQHPSYILLGFGYKIITDFPLLCRKHLSMAQDSKCQPWQIKLEVSLCNEVKRLRAKRMRYSSRQDNCAEVLGNQLLQ